SLPAGRNPRTRSAAVPVLVLPSVRVESEMPKVATLRRRWGMDLSVQLGRLRLANPIMVASGTFGYAREMAGLIDFARLGGVLPKTGPRQPRAGNPPPRTVETPSGMLNAIGLDNDGLDHFIRHHLPYLRTLKTAVVANIAGKTEDEFVEMAGQIG